MAIKLYWIKNKNLIKKSKEINQQYGNIYHKAAAPHPKLNGAAAKAGAANGAANGAVQAGAAARANGAAFQWFQANGAAKAGAAKAGAARGAVQAGAAAKAGAAFQVFQAIGAAANGEANDKPQAILEVFFINFLLLK